MGGGEIDGLDVKAREVEDGWAKCKGKEGQEMGKEPRRVVITCLGWMRRQGRLRMDGLRMDGLNVKEREVERWVESPDNRL